MKMVEMFKGTYNQRENAWSTIMHYPASLLNEESQENQLQQMINKTRNLAIDDEKTAAKTCEPLSDFEDSKSDSGKNDGNSKIGNDDDDADQPGWVDGLIN